MNHVNLLLLLCSAFILLIPFNARSKESAQAFLEPYLSAQLDFPGRAKVAKIHVKEGTKVTQGTLLSAFDTTVLDARLRLSDKALAVHGDLDAAKAIVDMRRIKLSTLLELEKKGNARPQELTTARANLDVAEAQMLEAQERRELREAEKEIILAQIEQNKLYSPFSGTITEINKQEGELTGGDNKPIMTLVQLDPLLAVFHLSPEKAYELQEKQDVFLKTTKGTTRAMVEYIATLIDAQSGTTTVRFVIPNPDSTLISGSRVVLMPIGQQEEANDVDINEQTATD